MWDLRILDEEGNVLPPETPGLLQCRGVGLMKEYWNNRQATLDNIDNDGWLDTGDIARIDEEGYLYIMDRAKDLIIRGGENISCAEVESAVYDHPAVKEATSFGMKEERLGEEVAVAITPKDGETVDATEFIAFVSQRLAKFKVPTRVFIWPGDLPRGTTGKIPKRDVRDDIEEGKTAGVVELNLAAAKLQNNTASRAGREKGRQDAQLPVRMACCARRAHRASVRIVQEAGGSMERE